MYRSEEKLKALKDAWKRYIYLLMSTPFILLLIFLLYIGLKENNMNWIFNMAALALLLVGGFYDYYATMKLHKKGWLNTRINSAGQIITSREKNSFWMDGTRFQTFKFTAFKIGLAVFGTVLVFVTLIFVKNNEYHFAPFIYCFPVGAYHLYLGYKNSKNYKYIEEITGDNYAEPRTF